MADPTTDAVLPNHHHHGDDDHNDDAGGGDRDSTQQQQELLPPLTTRVIRAVAASPQRTIRPARLAADLGLSVEDATAELCGLLRAVGGGQEGEGATFRFEEVGDSGGDATKNTRQEEKAAATTSTKTMTMVFTFPPNFERRSRTHLAKATLLHTALRTLAVATRTLKVIVAFGLILSLAILTVATIVAMVAALIALARGGGGHGNNRAALTRRIRSAFFTLRQLLWCYAVFGPGMDPTGEHGGSDPFLRQAAGDVWLFLSVCCGSPSNLWFWFRVHALNRRMRSRSGGGGFGRWSSRRSSDDASTMEGVSFVREGEWSREQRQRDGGWRRTMVGSTFNDSVAAAGANASSLPPPPGDDGQQGYRGLLSVAVEFLFGPSPFLPGPSEAERWRLRARTIVSLSSSSGEKKERRGVSLEELMPYSESPPPTSSLDEDDQRSSGKVITEGLRIVSHFNGIPAPGGSSDGGDDGGKGKARFVFPELMAEASDDGALFSQFRYDQGDAAATTTDDSRRNLLFVRDPAPFDGLSAAGGQTLGGGGSGDRSSRTDNDELLAAAVPSHLRERRLVLTQLSPSQFYQCCLLGLLNYVGVRWLRQSIGFDGLLRIGHRPTFVLADGVLAVLQFYATLFFALPLGRLGIVLAMNYFIDGRNFRRAASAEALELRRKRESNARRREMVGASGASGGVEGGVEMSTL